MTIHAAKGLEFPVTVVTGLTTQPQRRPAPAEVVWPPGQPCLIPVGRPVASEAFEAYSPIDEQMSHDERVRLLYVACTRARTTSSCRSTARPGQVHPTRRQAHQRRAAGHGALDGLPTSPTPPRRHRRREPAAAPRRRRRRRPPPTPGRPLPRSTSGAATARRSPPAGPGTVAATALTDDGRPEAAGRPRPPQAAPRPRPAAVAEGPLRHRHRPGRPRRAPDGRPRHRRRPRRRGRRPGGGRGRDRPRRPHRRLVTAALPPPSVIEAAAAPLARAVRRRPLGGGRLLEGYVDLLYRASRRGLVVVDYKTGPTGPDVDLDPLVDRYRLQGASYALAVADATGEPVVDMVFAFLTPTGPAERSLPDLPDAVAHVRRLAAEGDPSLAAVTMTPPTITSAVTASHSPRRPAHVDLPTTDCPTTVGLRARRPPPVPTPPGARAGGPILPGAHPRLPRRPGSRGLRTRRPSGRLSPSTRAPGAGGGAASALARVVAGCRVGARPGRARRHGRGRGRRHRLRAPPGGAGRHRHGQDARLPGPRHPVRPAGGGGHRHQGPAGPAGRQGPAVPRPPPRPALLLGHPQGPVQLRVRPAPGRTRPWPRAPPASAISWPAGRIGRAGRPRRAGRGWRHGRSTLRPTGDRAELPVEPDRRSLERRQHRLRDCPGAARCPRGDRCFAEAARDRAADADVVVVNLHLYGLDLASRRRHPARARRRRRRRGPPGRRHHLRHHRRRARARALHPARPGAARHPRRGRRHRHRRGRRRRRPHRRARRPPRPADHRSPADRPGGRAGRWLGAGSRRPRPPCAPSPRA